MTIIQSVVIIGSIVIGIFSLGVMEDDCEEKERTEEHAKSNYERTVNK